MEYALPRQDVRYVPVPGRQTLACPGCEDNRPMCPTFERWGHVRRFIKVCELPISHLLKATRNTTRRRNDDHLTLQDDRNSTPFFSCYHMYTNIKSLGTSSTLSPRPTACGVAFQSWQKPAGIPHVWIRLLYFISSNFNHMHSFGNRVHLPVDIKHPSTCNRGRVVGQHLSWLCVCHANLTPWYTPTDSLITLFIDGSTCKIRFGMPVTKVRRRGMCHVIKRRCSSALSQSGILVFIWSFSNGDIGVYRLFFYSSKIKFRISYWL